MRQSKTYKIAATIILGITSLVWMIKGLGDLFGGVQGGIQNMIVAASMILLTLFSWKRPLLGGIITAFLGVVVAVVFNLILPDIYTAYVPLFLMFGPMVISGLLFIETDWKMKKVE